MFFSEEVATSVEPSTSPFFGVPSSTTESRNSQEETTEKVARNASTTPSTESDTVTATEDASELPTAANVTLSSTERDESLGQRKNENDKFTGKPVQINSESNRDKQHQTEGDKKGPNSNESNKNANLGHPTRAQTQRADNNFEAFQQEDNDGVNKVF